MNYRNLFDSNISITLKSASKLLTSFPKSAAALLKVAAHESKASKLREKWYGEGVCVPPLLIVSTTDSCNLHCKECYSQNSCREHAKELSPAKIDIVLNESADTGCSAVLLAGGEPLLSPTWLHTLAKHKELLGLVFTNGTLLNDSWADFFDKHRNLIPLFSVEGTRTRTDNRRGTGVSEKIEAAMALLQKHKIPFGISVTTGTHNITEVTADEFTAAYTPLGCRLVIYVEYVPMGTGNEFLPLTETDKRRLSEYCSQKANENKVIAFVFPGNEDIYDGCLAAGRGFIHISASGALEPCPFAPYSDASLVNMSYMEALKSPLLAVLRAEANLMHEGIGGCSLRNKEAWIKEIISAKR